MAKRIYPASDLGHCFLVFGSQLFEPKILLPHLKGPVVLIEHTELCSYYPFHKHKIAYFLSAMRHYRKELEALQIKTHYLDIAASQKFKNYIEALHHLVNTHKWTHLHCFEIEDKFMEQAILSFCKDLGLQVTFHPSPNFLTSRQEFKSYLERVKKPFMKTFYEGQRKRLNILLEPNGTPVGGAWSFDTQNRKSWPKNKIAPQIPRYQPDTIDQQVFTVTNSLFKNHPGSLDDFWIPTTRAGANLWLKDFIDNRLAEFGPFEDAFGQNIGEVLNHSVLTPFLNTGLINPQDVVDLALKKAKSSRQISIASIEGFIRQVIGWREFVRGVYQNYSEAQDTQNFFNHQRQINQNWYKGQTGCPPLDDVIKKVQKLAWCHHIERLMVLSNMMNLCEIQPKQAHKWFMELFIDSSDWVMGPNVYGMGLMSDGGLFATKPYICGSNYWLKMSNYKKEDWCLEVDGLYWRFIREKQNHLAKNPRMSMMVKTYQKQSADRKQQLESAALGFLKRNTL